MDEKQFLITSLQLIEVSLARGAVKGEEVKVISARRDYISQGLQKYQEPVSEPVEELVEETEVAEEAEE